MECTVPVQVYLATDHADVGSLERTVSAALRQLPSLAGVADLLDAALAA